MIVNNDEAFARVFSDAHILDLDFSLWDENLSVLLVADHFEASGPAVLVVTFRAVRHFSVVYNHHDIELENGHFQWLIHEAREHPPTHKGRRSTRLSGHHASPVTEIEFDDFEILEVDQSLLDRIAPGWREPGGPFVRRGWLHMLREESP
ncbi:MAG: hypothetical protein AAFQ65_01415 [Myxococcota bacterium]